MEFFLYLMEKHILKLVCELMESKFNFLKKKLKDTLSGVLKELRYEDRIYNIK